MLNKQRIIQSIGFEVGGVILFVLLVMPFLEYGVLELGVLGIGFSFLAMLLLYFYNPVFDAVLKKLTGCVIKSIQARLMHALLFELLFLMLSLPVVMWWLNIGLIPALALEAVSIVFMLVYTYVFHWLVDRFFIKPSM